MSASPNLPICRLDQLAEGTPAEIEAQLADGPASLILCRRGETALAWLNVCPHAGRALSWAPGRFLMEDGLLVCAAHGASFELERGECVRGPCRGQSLRQVAIEVRDGAVYLAG